MVENWQLAYSSVIVDRTDVAFQSILERSRLNNKWAGVSGVLLRDKTSYFQYLEGPRGAVAECMLKIARDPRHTQVTFMLSRPTQVLLFDGWSLSQARLPNRKKSIAPFAKMLLKNDEADRAALIEQTCMEAEIL